MQLEMVPRPGNPAQTLKPCSSLRGAAIEFKWTDVYMCDSQGSLFLINHKTPFLALQQAVKIAGVKVLLVLETTRVWTCAEHFKAQSYVTLENLTLAWNPRPLSRVPMKFNNLPQGSVFEIIIIRRIKKSFCSDLQVSALRRRTCAFLALQFGNYMRTSWRKRPSFKELNLWNKIHFHRYFQKLSKA